MSKFDKIKYINEYNISHYDRINLLTPRGLKSAIKAHAAARGESVNAFISRAAAAQIERDRAEDERRAAERNNPEAVTPSEAPAPTPTPETVTPSEAPAPTPTPETVTPSEPETAGAEQSRPTSDGKQTAAEAHEDSAPRTDNSPAEISTAPTDNKPTTSKPRRGRRPKQTEQDPAQLTLDDTTDSGSGRG